jgi:hypothetical protein
MEESRIVLHITINDCGMILGTTSTGVRYGHYGNAEIEEITTRNSFLTHSVPDERMRTVQNYTCEC